MRVVSKMIVKKMVSWILLSTMVISLVGCQTNETAAVEESVEVSTQETGPEAVIGEETAAPKYIFYLIGDGMGQSHRQLAESFQRYKLNDENYMLAMNDMPVTSLVTTNSLSSLVTDSAAAGTALATGMKTISGAVGVGPDGETYTSIADALKEKGMGIGLVTTVGVTHATPAAFGANLLDRNDEITIAEQYLEAGWDFMAGGGRRYFTDTTEGGKREEGDSLLEAYTAAGYAIDLNLEEFEDTDFAAIDKYLGIYESKYLTDVITQTYGEKTSPELYEMVETGIEVLSKNENGFFMMVEGGFIDGASHNNDTAATLYEVLSFEKAVQSAVDFYHKHPEETLIIVTADHETGGLSLGVNAYSVDMARLDEIKVSFDNAIDIYGAAGDMDSFFEAMEENWHLTLSEKEKEDILYRIHSFDMVPLFEDFGYDASEAAQYEGLEHMMGVNGYASAPVLAKYTKIGWGTQTHTSEPVAVTVMGPGCNEFAQCRDNTDIPKALAKIMDVSIGEK